MPDLSSRSRSGSACTGSWSASSRRWRARAAPCTTSRTRRGSSRWTWRGRSGTSRATSRSTAGCWSTWAATSGSSRRRRSSGAAPAPRTPPPASPGVNRGLEGLACDVFNQLVQIARKIRDPDHRAGGRLRAGRRDHPRADGLLLAQRSSPRAIPSGAGAPSSSRSPSTSASTSAACAGRGRARPGADLDRDRVPEARRLHRRGDRAARQEHAAQSQSTSCVTARARRGPARRAGRHLGVEPPPVASATTATPRSG